ncbi:PTS sugar transporter [Photobacterium swingsii]|uniref:PTS sugar transporter n=1 Tax=Photobacterium swingsii TaxID=680026 RepID=A0A0J8XZM5_9GAMM|nr:N-acetylglucosamine-specific PTS transporter subunit IIBC [Photobacterium swingsii]KMV30854.1 PTS sugar transporter [Photobacterium swingsii]PSW25815.1 PTS sugar transporter [Photobacterium swingsii]
MNILGYFQKLGKALMLPIAVLPVAGLLLRFGQPDLLDVAFMAQAGQSIFDNIALLFAMGVAAGLSKDGSAAAAIAAVVGHTVMLAALGTMNADIDPGVAGGIIAGITAGHLYNRFYNIQLPDFLGFFAGKRFVPIITGLVSLGLAISFSLIWPPIQSAINMLGEWMLGSGVAGTFTYGFANRLLIPFGLHHILNTMVWFVFGEYNGVTGEISRFWAEDPQAGLMLAGFFPIMMFGLPAAAVAFYYCAKPENKARVGGMLASVAFTAFLTGITEPLEFLFMFLAPVLYVVHAVFMGLSLVIASLLDVHLVFSFSAGLIDYVLNFNAPAALNAWKLLPLGLAFAVLYFVTFTFAIKTFDLKTPGREDEADEKAMPDTEVQSGELANAYLMALGGKGNLTDIDACITRLRLTVVDRSKIDDAKVKALGAKGIVNVGEKNVQVVLGPQAEIIATEMKQL